MTPLPCHCCRRGQPSKVHVAVAITTATRKPHSQRVSGQLETSQRIITQKSAGSPQGSLQGTPQVLACSWDQQVWGKGLS